MSATLERIETPIEYAYETPHLKESEVLDRYARERAHHPGAIVVIEDLDCGHHEVQVYESQVEKQAFYNKRLSLILRRLYGAFSNR